MSNSDYIVVYFGGSMHGKIECSAFCGDRREVRTRSGTEIYYYTRTQRVGDYDVLVAECEPFAPDRPWHTTPQPGEAVTGTTELPEPAQEPGGSTAWVKENWLVNHGHRCCGGNMTCEGGLQDDHFWVKDNRDKNGNLAFPVPYCPFCGEAANATKPDPKPAQEPALPANAIVFVLCDDGIPDGWERAGMTLYDASYKPAIGSYKTLIGIRRKKVGDG